MSLNQQLNEVNTYVTMNSSVTVEKVNIFGLFGFGKELDCMCVCGCIFVCLYLCVCLWNAVLEDFPADFNQTLQTGCSTGLDERNCVLAN